MTRFLVNMNILSDLVSDAGGLVARRTIELGGLREVYTSVIVAAELRFGLAKRRSSRLADQLERVLAEVDVVPFSPPADAIYGTLGPSSNAPARRSARTISGSPRRRSRTRASS